MIKMRAIFVILLYFISFSAIAQDVDREKLLKYKKFQRGERLEYACHIGLLKVGKAEVTVNNDLFDLSGNICYRVDVEGKTTGVFSMGMKVKDLWRSFIDTAMIAPIKFYRDIQENNYLLEETTYFDHSIQKVRVDGNLKGRKRGGIYDIPKYSQDLISGYLYLRTLDYEDLPVDSVITVPAFFEDKVYYFQVRYLGKQQIRTRFGKQDTYVLTPIMPQNGLFLSGENAIKIWVSADKNRIPLRVNASMLFGIGLVEVSLVDYAGLQEPIDSKKKR